MSADADEMDASTTTDAGTAVVAPPAELPGDEHGVWQRFAACGATDQFRMPNEETNRRLKQAQRGVHRRNRRRDNKLLLERLEAAAQQPSEDVQAAHQEVATVDESTRRAVKRLFEAARRRPLPVVDASTFGTLATLTRTYFDMEPGGGPQGERALACRALEAAWQAVLQRPVPKKVEFGVDADACGWARTRTPRTASSRAVTR